ncbi:MAG: T9SS type A sorting domain-containing protein [Psychroserpens sp.]|uniref:T9SS type A sorting domain-containing protein n=1 Tax=Psychroserpens sp. TaxID=2020870 RepID=UPI0030017444
MKNLYTLIITIFVSTYSFAQSDLFVGSGSYVYVDGTAFTSGPTVAPLYVTDDVNLANNGNIYLRNDAQLIQGNNVGNSGTGQLSVYQTGNSNTYMYNYWSSPVGMNSGVAGNTSFRPNNNIYGETLAPITSLAATYVAEPNYDGIAGTPPTIASFWFYSYIGINPPPNDYLDWVVIDESTSNLASGYGWTMKGNPSGAQQYDFRGRPNNGNMSVSINPNRETLIGNPYPSALDAYYFIHDTQNQSNTTGVLKFWEQQPGATSHVLSNYVGGYALYTNFATNTNGTPSDLTDDTVMDSFTPAVFYMYLLDGTIAGGPPITNSFPKISYRYIPVGQGFIMEGSATASSIRFNNSQRSFYKQSGTNSSFFRLSETNSSSFNETDYTEEGYNIVPEDCKRFRINVGFDNNGIESYTRQLLMNFHHTATDGFDYGLEAKGAGDLESDANWTLDGEPYAIQAFEYDETLTIPLIINIANLQFNTFSINDVQNFDESQPIYLHDIDANLYVDLRTQNYSLNLPAGVYDSRFEITFRQESLTTEEVTDEDFVVFLNTKNAELTILNPNGLDITSVSLYDVAGKRVINTVNIGNQNAYRYSTKSFSDGVYITTITVEGNTAITKKVIIKN